MPRMVKTSFQMDEQLLADVKTEAEERGELFSVIAREWLRLGRDEARQDRSKRPIGEKPSSQTPVPEPER